MALAPDGVEMDRVSENKTWYTQSVPNSSKNKGDLETSKIVKILMKRIE